MRADREILLGWIEDMTTLIAVYNSEGCVGRCDAKCYNAEHEHCDCICGGTNHGAGVKKAMENTQELAESWIENWKKEHPDIESSDFEVLPQPVQLELFRA